MARSAPLLHFSDNTCKYALHMAHKVLSSCKQAIKLGMVLIYELSETSHSNSWIHHCYINEAPAVRTLSWFENQAERRKSVVVF